MASEKENPERLQVAYDLAEAQRQMWFTCALFVRHRAGEIYSRGGNDHVAETLRSLAGEMERSDGFARSQGYFRGITESLYRRIEATAEANDEAPDAD